MVSVVRRWRSLPGWRRSLQSGFHAWRTNRLSVCLRVRYFQNWVSQMWREPLEHTQSWASVSESLQLRELVERCGLADQDACQGLACARKVSPRIWFLLCAFVSQRCLASRQPIATLSAFTKLNMQKCRAPRSGADLLRASMERWRVNACAGVAEVSLRSRVRAPSRALLGVLQIATGADRGASHGKS